MRFGFGKMHSKVLTPLQYEILDLLFNRGLGDQGFYFTGGTALNEFYYPFRQSEDLDFFINTDEILLHIQWVIKLLEDHDYRFEITQKNKNFVEVIFSKQEPLILHFCTHPQPNIQPHQTFGKVIVDSLVDIAVNKVTCLPPSREEPKDSFDLYYILNHTNFTFDYLLTKAKEKSADFDNDEYIFYMATSLLDIPTEPLPMLIENTDPQAVKDYFKTIGKELINRYRPSR